MRARRVCVALVGCLVAAGWAPAIHGESKKEREAAIRAKFNARGECLKAARLEGYYITRSADVPASTVMGREGKGALDGAMARIYSVAFVEDYATLSVSADGKERSWDAPHGSFQKDELVVVSLDERTRGIHAKSAYKHNVTRGEGAFRRESPEFLALLIVGGAAADGMADPDVSCEALTRSLANHFERVDEATVANWEKAHPEIANGVIVPSLREGMTTAEVEALFGAPERRAEMGGKTIYFYPKMKVTFTEGKVSGID